MTDRELFITNLIGLADMLEKDLSDQLLEIYHRGLKPYGYSNAASVLSTMALSRSKRDGFPTLAEIIDVLDPRVEAKDAASEAANLIWAAIPRCGKAGSEKAKEMIGELGWAVVERMGGWSALCGMKTSERGTFIAQARELATTVHKKAAMGILEEKPGLPSPGNQKQLGSGSQQGSEQVQIGPIQGPL